VLQSKVRSECRNIIQNGFGTSLYYLSLIVKLTDSSVSILKKKDYIHSDKKMNYVNYKSKIVEKLGVALIGWPEDSKVENPGSIGLDEGLALRNALENKECRWTILTSKQQEAQKCRNAQHEQDGEAMYGPPRKKQAKSTRE